MILLLLLLFIGDVFEGSGMLVEKLVYNMCFVGGDVFEKVVYVGYWFYYMEIVIYEII